FDFLHFVSKGLLVLNQDRRRLSWDWFVLFWTFDFKRVFCFEPRKKGFKDWQDRFVGHLVSKGPFVLNRIGRMQGWAGLFCFGHLVSKGPFVLNQERKDLRIGRIGYSVG